MTTVPKDRASHNHDALTVLVVGVVARRQIAEVLVASLTSDEALRKTFELVAIHGPAQHDLDPEFARLESDAPGALDAARDLPNMPLQEEPPGVQDDLEAAGRHH